MKIRSEEPPGPWPRGDSRGARSSVGGDRVGRDGATWGNGAPRAHCGGPLQLELGEAILHLEVRSLRAAVRSCVILGIGIFVNTGEPKPAFERKLLKRAMTAKTATSMAVMTATTLMTMTPATTTTTKWARTRRRTRTTTTRATPTTTDDRRLTMMPEAATRITTTRTTATPTTPATTELRNPLEGHAFGTWNPNHNSESQFCTEIWNLELGSEVDSQIRNRTQTSEPKHRIRHATSGSKF